MLKPVIHRRSYLIIFIGSSVRSFICSFVRLFDGFVSFSWMVVNACLVVTDIDEAIRLVTLQSR